MSSAADSDLGLPTAADGRLDCDYTCLRCRYNLRGLATDGKCPECGLPVRASFELGQLHKADVGWLRAVAGGTSWAMVGLAGLLGYVIIALISDWHAAAAGNHDVHNFWTVASTPAMAVGLLASAVGFWMITRPMPTQWCPPRLVRYRRLTRVTITATLPLVPLCAWIPMFTHKGVIPVWIVSAFLLSAGMLFALRYASLLAALVNHRALLWQTRAIMAGFALFWAAAVLLLLWIEAAPNLRRLVYYPPLRTSSRVMIATLFILATWTLVVLWFYRQRYQQAAALADETTAGATRDANG